MAARRLCRVDELKDGSAQGFVRALHDAGAELQPARRPVWGVESPLVVSRDGATLALYPAAGDELKITYTLDYEYDGVERMAWTSRPGGDVKHIEGSYEFEINDEGGTTVTYDLAIDPGFPVPGFALKRAARHITAAALDGLKARAEDG